MRLGFEPSTPAMACAAVGLHGNERQFAGGELVLADHSLAGLGFQLALRCQFHAPLQRRNRFA